MFVSKFPNTNQVSLKHPFFVLFKTSLIGCGWQTGRYARIIPGSPGKTPGIISEEIGYLKKKILMRFFEWIQIFYVYNMSVYFIYGRYWVLKAHLFSRKHGIIQVFMSKPLFCCCHDSVKRRDFDIFDPFFFVGDSGEDDKWE